MSRRVAAGIFLGLTVALLGAGPSDLLIEVNAGAKARRDTLVHLPIPASIPPARSATLSDTADGSTLPGQVSTSADGVTLTFVIPQLEASASKRYRVRLTTTPPANPAAECRKEPSHLALRVNGKPVLAYATATIEPPPGIDPVYRRSGFLHPLATPSGRVVTAEFPPDHAHQHGGFFAWVNTTFDGHKVDFWNQKDRLGRVRHIDVVDFESGPVFAGFTARLRHEDISRPGDPIPALDEVWNIRAYRIGPHHVVDFESAQKCAGDRPLRMNKYHYGGFGIRGNSAWYDPQSTGETPPDPERSGKAEFLTSEGKHRLEGNHSRPRWVDLSGMLEGAFAGVTVLDHPTNFRFPQPVRLHPNKPYFCFAPMVEGEFRIEPGSTYVSRYRLILHDGPPEVAAIERLYDDYRDPPTVRLLAKE